MPRLVVLGSASAVAVADHDNTHMVLEGSHSAVLIDCVGSTFVRLQRVGIRPHDVGDIILTHFHPDHVTGFPNFLMATWRSGRQAPLRVYGLHHCLERVENMMSGFQWEQWQGFYPVAFHHLPQREGVVVLDNPDFHISASPVQHYVPTIGLRVVVKETGFVLSYSSDTVPCDQVVRLGARADLLIHEATGDEPLGHSSAAQAGEIAQRAGARMLGLIHYAAWNTTPQERAALVTAAQTTFDGDVFLCEDLQEMDLHP